MPRIINKLNTFLRLLVVGLLVWPFPIAIADEVTVNEGFSDQDWGGYFTITRENGNSHNTVYTENSNYGTQGQFLSLCHQVHSNCSHEYTFEFSSDIDVYEVGFEIGAVNQAYSVTFHYSDNTTETENKSAQAYGNNGADMYDTFYKSFTDNNADENNTDKFITKFVVDIHDWSSFDDMYFQYDDSVATGSFATTTTTSSTTTLPTVGVPTNFTVTKNDNGSITVDWDAPTTGNTTPDRYTVQYGDNGVLDQNPNTTDTEMTFTRSDLETALGLSNSEDIAYMFHVKAENVAQSLESAFTDVVTITIGKSPSGVGNNYTITESTSGITVDWDAPTSNWVDIGGYRILVAETYDSDYSANTWFEVYRSTDTSTTEFTLPWVDNSEAIDYTTLNGTYYYRISTCASSWWCNDVEATYTVDNTLGPPMNPTVENVYNSGVLVEWDEPNTGTRTATTYELYYRTSAENETVVYNITETSYTIPYSAIANGTWEFSIRGYNSVYNVYSGYSTEPSLEVFNQKAQDDWEEEERKRKEREAEEARQRELQRQRDKNLSETGYSETDQERSDREYAEEQARLAELQRQRDKNAAETGYSETDDERADREYKEEQERLAELERQRNANQAETGYFETDEERADREAAELAAEKARIEEEIKNAVVLPVETETDEDGNVVEVELTEEEQEELEELVDAIIDIKNTVDFEEFEVEEEVIEIDIDLEDVVIVFEPVEEDELEQDETDTSDSGFPIPEEKSEEELEDLSEDELEEYKEERKEVVEAYVEELEEEIIEEVLPETVTVEEFKEIKEKDVEELTEEEVAIVVEVATEVIEEVVDTEELTEVIEAEDIVILEEEELEDLSEEELEAYEEELEEVIEEFVEELETEELVVVVEQIAEVGVENLAVADEQTIKVVQAVVAEVVDTETVEELSEEEVEAVAEVLGFEEEEDVAIIAEIAAEEEAVAEAVSEYVERAVENADVENYTLADTVTEVQVELFLENPVGQLLDVKIDELDISSLGDDMTSDQKEKAQEVVVPVILVSQVIAQAGAVLRRF